MLTFSVTLLGFIGGGQDVHSILKLSILYEGPQVLVNLKAKFPQCLLLEKEKCPPIEIAKSLSLAPQFLNQ